MNGSGRHSTLTGDNVGKNALAATSLVAALPAAFLAYLGVMAFLQHADAMPTVLMAAVGVALAASVALVLSPFAILIFGPKSGAAADTSAGAADNSAAQDSVAAAASSVGELDDLEPAETEQYTSGELDAIGADSAEFDAVEDDDAFEFEDDEK